MRRLLAFAVSLTILVGAAGPARAAVKVVDSYCAPTGDFCTLIAKKADGTLVFRLRTFPKLFKAVDVCVTKQTRVCDATRLDKGPHIWVFHIRWQGRYPREGAGRYKVRWLLSQSGDRLGPALYFRRA